jgi:hypothetical protein
MSDGIRLVLLRGGVAVIILIAVMCGYGKDGLGHLVVEIIDAETGQPTPARVRLVDDAGSPAGRPEGALQVRWGPNDTHKGDMFQPDSAFYTDGGFTLRAQPGTYHLEISKGIEFLPERRDITLTADDLQEFRFELQRWVDMRTTGWYSGDDHIHLSRTTPELNHNILRWVAAEDLHIGNILRMGDARRTYFEQYAFGKQGRYQEQDYALVPGQEDPRTFEIGHTISLNIPAATHDSANYYLYDRVFDASRRNNGMSGYAHQGESFNGYRGLSLDVPRGKVDFIELLQQCVPGGPLLLQFYYRFLDMGYRINALAGSDFPWCGRDTGGPRIGNVRFYTHLDGDFSVDRWAENAKAGHTFVSNGPMLKFTVNDALPGEEISVTPGETVKIRATAIGHQGEFPLKNLSIVGHSQILGRSEKIRNEGSRQYIELSLDLPLDTGIWLAAVCSTNTGQMAHSTPVYCRVSGGPTWNPASLAGNLADVEVDLREVETLLQGKGNASDQIRLNINAHRWNTAEWTVVDRSEGRMFRSAAGLQQRVDDARIAYRKLARQAGVAYPEGP